MRMYVYNNALLVSVPRNDLFVIHPANYAP